MKLGKSLLLIFLVFTLWSCAETEEENVSPTTNIFGIRGDLSLASYEKIATNEAPYSAGTEYPDFSPVVFIKIRESKDDIIGSGVLIAPNWVLTAAHTFYVPGEDKKPKEASATQILIGQDPNAPKATYQVESIIFHPTWADGDGGFEKGNDICLIKLTKNVVEVSVASINLDKKQPTLNSKLWFAGFGDYSERPGQNANLFSKKHALENILDRKVDALTSTKNGVSYEGGLLAFDFDSPDGSINTLGDNIMNEQEKVLGSGVSLPTALPFEATTVSGDSGGPLLAYLNGTWKVIGVLHGGIDDVAPNIKDSAYGDISVFTQTASHEAWIKNTIK